MVARRLSMVVIAGAIAGAAVALYLRKRSDDPSDVEETWVKPSAGDVPVRAVGAGPEEPDIVLPPGFSPFDEPDRSSALDSTTSAPPVTPRRPPNSRAAPHRKDWSRELPPTIGDDAKLIWYRRLTSDGIVRVQAISVAANGDVALVGNLNGKDAVLDISGEKLRSPSNLGRLGFVARWGGDGLLQFLEGYDNGLAYGVSTDGAGNSYITGSYTRWSNYFDDGITCNGAIHWYAMALDQNGQRSWLLRGRRTAQVWGNAAATGPDGRMYVVGAFGPGKVELGGTTLQTTSGYVFGSFLAAIDRGGRIAWARQLAGIGMDTRHVAVNPRGQVIVAGTFEAAIAELGGAPLVNIGLEPDAFVAAYDRDGTPLWSRRFGGRLADRTGGLAVGPGGEVALAATTDEGPLDLGAGEVERDYRHQMFVVMLGPDGTPRWSALSEGNNSVTPKAVAIDDSGRALVSGFTYARAMELGGLVAGMRGRGRDMFLARFSANGERIWLGRYGPDDDANADAVAPAGGHDVFLAGHYRGQGLEIARHRIEGAKSTDSYIVRLRLPAEGVRRADQESYRSAADSTPASVFRVGPQPPHNPRLEPDTLPYFGELYFWLGMALPVTDLDVLRRIDTTGTERGDAERVRLLAADRIIRELLPSALGRDAAALRDLPPIADAGSAASARHALKQLAEKKGNRGLREIAWHLDNMLDPNKRDEQKARDTATMIALGVAESSPRSQGVEIARRLIVDLVETARR